jgi:hypothetical protein
MAGSPHRIRAYLYLLGPDGGSLTNRREGGFGFSASAKNRICPPGLQFWKPQLRAREHAIRKLGRQANPC